MHGITIGVDFVLVIIWFGLCTCVCVSLCAFVWLLTGVDSLNLFLLPLFILLYSLSSLCLCYFILVPSSSLIPSLT